MAVASREAPPVSDKVASAYASIPKIAATPDATFPPAPKLTFSDGTKAVFFGDSWTLGTSARPATKGFAYETISALHLNGQVEGVGGTGYLNPGLSGNQTYLQRINAFPVSDAALVVLQGSVNDQNQNQITMGDEVDKVFAAMHAKFPAAQIVVLGPAPSDLPANSGVMRADDIIGNRAKAAGLNYISPLRQQWITPENFGSVIDPATHHPSTEGHSYLASKLVTALTALKG